MGPQLVDDIAFGEDSGDGVAIHHRQSADALRSEQIDSFLDRRSDRNMDDGAIFVPFNETRNRHGDSPCLSFGTLTMT